MNKLFTAIPEKNKKILVSGNEAIARGLLESGIGFGSTYPGTPVSEVGDILHNYSQTEQGKHLIFDYALNEKVALEEAVGAAWTGLRSVVIFKHLGMNVASDALHTIMYSGIGGGKGLVLIVGGDPQASSSTNAEDVRLYSKHTYLPILFPSSVEELYIFTKAAYDMSEAVGLPIMVYTTPKLSFMTSMISPEPIPDIMKLYRKSPSFSKNFEKYINARHFALQHKENLKNIVKQLEKPPFNNDFIELPANISESKIAIISGGYPYLILKDVLSYLGLSEKIPILKLNKIYPISPESIIDFVKKSNPKELLIIEELEPMIENEVKRILYDAQQLIPIQNIWKYSNEELKGEITHALIEIALSKEYKKRKPNGLRDYLTDLEKTRKNVPQREPTFCPGCSHRNVFFALRKVTDTLRKAKNLELIFGGDIGCYTLGMSPPWSVMDWLICMGAGVGIANGVGRVLEHYNNPSQHVVAIIGDSTFYHSGIQPIINALKQNLNISILILNNYYSSMTGGQSTVSKTDVQQLDELIGKIGSSQLTVVGGYDIHKLEKTFMKNFTQKKKGTRIIVVNAECALAVKRHAKEKWDKPRGSERGEELYIQINESCPMCHVCFQEYGCTAIKHRKIDGRLMYYIDESACMKEYCQACIDVCPNHCIEKTIINPKGEEK